MSNVELKNMVIEWLQGIDKKFIVRPCRFTPKEVADAVGGVHTAVGKIAEDVVLELSARGVRICYLKLGNRRFFQLF